MEKSLVRQDSVVATSLAIPETTEALANVLAKDLYPDFINKIEDRLLFCDHVAFGFLVYESCQSYAANVIPAINYYEKLEKKRIEAASREQAVEKDNSWKRRIILPWSKTIADIHVLNARVIEALCLLEHFALLSELGVSPETYPTFTSSTYTFLPPKRKLLFKIIDGLSMPEGQQVTKNVQRRYFHQLANVGNAKPCMSSDLSVCKFLEIPVSIWLNSGILEPDYELLVGSLQDIGKSELATFLPRLPDIESASLASTIVMTSDVSSNQYPPDQLSVIVPKFDMSKPGRCIIINQKTFDYQPKECYPPEIKEVMVEFLEDRLGTQYDSELLERTFASLNCKVTVEENLTSRELREFFQNFSRNSFKDSSILVVCILSHGKEGHVFGTDRIPVSLRELKSNFTATRCPSLAEKPKLFFMQACQGEIGQIGLTESHIRTDGPGVSPLIPDFSNFYEAWSTVRGFVSYRNPSSGSWFMRTLCRHLLDHGHKLDIKTIMTLVTGNVAEANNGHHKQVPQVCDDCLRKSVRFNRNEEDFLQTIVWKLANNLWDSYVEEEVQSTLRNLLPLSS